MNSNKFGSTKYSLVNTVILLVGALALPLQAMAQTTSMTPQGAETPGQAEGQPSPYYVQRSNDKSTFSTKALNAMPQFSAIPAYTRKVRFMGGNKYNGEGTVNSATFEVAEPLPIVLQWYGQELAAHGWKVTKRENRNVSARLNATLPGQTFIVDIQLLPSETPGYRTRIYAKEVGYQNISCQQVGGGEVVSPEHVPSMSAN